MQINTSKLYKDLMKITYDKDKEELDNCFSHDRSFKVDFGLALFMFSMLTIGIYENVKKYIFLLIIVSIIWAYSVVKIAQCFHYMAILIYTKTHNNFWKDTLFVFIHLNVLKEKVIGYTLNHSLCDSSVGILSNLCKQIENIKFIKQENYILNRTNNKCKKTHTNYYIELEKDILQDIYISGEFGKYKLHYYNKKYYLYDDSKYAENNYYLKILMNSDEEELYICTPSQKYNMPQEIRNIFLDKQM